MLLIVIHIVGIGLLILGVGTAAYQMGLREGERRTKRRIELDREES